jgi:hypothetical protein
VFELCSDLHYLDGTRFDGVLQSSDSDSSDDNDDYDEETKEEKDITDLITL